MTSNAITTLDASAIESFDDALDALQTAGIPILTSIPAIGDGYTEIKKDALVGVPFLIVSWENRTGDIAGDDGEIRDYVGVRIITKDNRKGYFSDGGMGVASQLNTLTAESGVTGGLLVEHGLDFFTTKKYGKRTYFLAAQPVTSK